MKPYKYLTLASHDFKQNWKCLRVHGAFDSGRIKWKRLGKRLLATSSLMLRAKKTHVPR